MGPTAYPHRASAAENPVGTLGHHQQDSTHIADDVVTVGLTYGMARIEASGFHGREPDEFRWDIDQGKIDSWSTRLTIQPGKNWSGQYSYARIKSPEAVFPNEDQERMTASIMYNRPLHNGNWANTILWGRTRSLQDNSIFNSYLLESTVRFHTRNYAWTRIENAERSNELIIGENPLPPGFREEPIGRVQAYTFGYDHDFDFIPHLSLCHRGTIHYVRRTGRIETNLRFASSRRRSLRAIPAIFGAAEIEMRFWKTASLILLAIVVVAGFGIALIRRGFSARGNAFDGRDSSRAQPARNWPFRPTTGSFATLSQLQPRISEPAWSILPIIAPRAMRTTAAATPYLAKACIQNHRICARPRRRTRAMASCTTPLKTAFG